jgi:hypothetical protein
MRVLVQKQPSYLFKGELCNENQAKFTRHVCICQFNPKAKCATFTKKPYFAYFRLLPDGMYKGKVLNGYGGSQDLGSYAREVLKKLGKTKGHWIGGDITALF